MNHDCDGEDDDGIVGPTMKLTFLAICVYMGCAKTTYIFYEF